MNPKIAIPAALVAIAAVSSGTAIAQENTQPFLRQYLEPPRKAFELSVGTGYTEGFGSLYQGVGMPSVAHEGIALDLGLGYRIDPHWMVGATGEYQELNAQRAQTARGVTAGIQAAYHFSPTTRVDPWVSLGTGYRWLWENYEATSTSVLTQGLQMGRLMLGLDMRASREVAIAPVIGADLDTFLSQGNGGIDNPRVSTFVHAGLEGRFDLGGEYDQSTVTARHTDLSEVGVAERQAPAPQPPPVVYVSPGVSVSTDVAKACELKLGNASEFGFDDSTLTEADRVALDTIAACFTTGPLKGDGMRIVGRADPRGTPQYNMDLGQRRATSAAAYLNQKGVDPSRMEQTSRGALDATGYDETGWANDRRVDISIAH